jgi:Pvc16 N-terminal domain
MLHELDTALRALVEREVGANGDIQVDFDAPTKDWASHRNRPTIDIYLYDIRQDLTRYQFGHVNVHNEEGFVAQRQPQPKFFRLAYLMTAWTQRAEDEHRLLSALMVTFLRHETVPADLLDGSLAELEFPIPIAVALPPPQDRSLSDVWSALGGELKPSLDVTIIAPLLPERATDAGGPVRAEPRLSVARRGAPSVETAGGRPVPDGVERVPGQRPPPPASQPRLVRRARTRK